MGQCNIPGVVLLVLLLLLFLFPQLHGHHAPGQILHALLVGQLALGLAVEAPYRGRERVSLLHFLGVIEFLGDVALPIGEIGVLQKLVAHSRVLW